MVNYSLLLRRFIYANYKLYPVTTSFSLPKDTSNQSSSSPVTDAIAITLYEGDDIGQLVHEMKGCPFSPEELIVDNIICTISKLVFIDDEDDKEVSYSIN